jgi:hypothetical protein
VFTGKALGLAVAPFGESVKRFTRLDTGASKGDKRLCMIY